MNFYNPSYKIQYIKERANSIKEKDNIVDCFEKVASYEAKAKCDISYMEPITYKKLLNGLCRVHSSSANDIIRVIRDYVQWCYDKKYGVTVRDLIHIIPDGSEVMKKKTVSGPLQLQIYLDSVYDAEEDETIDCLYRCFYWFAFAGIDEKDLANLRRMDIDFNNLVIRYNKKEYELYKEGIKALKNAATLREFKFDHSLYKQKNPKRDRFNPTYIMSGYRSILSYKILRATISDRSKEAVDNNRTDKRLTYGNVAYSGLFYRVFEMEYAGVPLDFTDYILTHYNFNGKQSKDTVKKGVLKDYSAWKMAHYGI